MEKAPGPKAATPGALCFSTSDKQPRALLPGKPNVGLAVVMKKNHSCVYVMELSTWL